MQYIDEKPNKKNHFKNKSIKELYFACEKK